MVKSKKSIRESRFLGIVSDQDKEIRTKVEFKPGTEQMRLFSKADLRWDFFNFLDYDRKKAVFGLTYFKIAVILNYKGENYIMRLEGDKKCM